MFEGVNVGILIGNFHGLYVGLAVDIKPVYVIFICRWNPSTYIYKHAQIDIPIIARKTAKHD